ncbi:MULTISPECIES: hypothetical protein [Halomonadaceae]|uniref:hypothetical protein n=1 Tax=Halomonadaceae TaxID=28256 RepID=UPI001582998A|nr:MULTISPECIES: hypothetical protein [Halomonas]MDI4637404.1 hypothetical protein [Halomonas sp. BMC7]NUJ61239.1 hypothetical protein [Halomonas taeanensis]
MHLIKYEVCRFKWLFLHVSDSFFLVGSLSFLLIDIASLDAVSGIKFHVGWLFNRIGKQICINIKINHIAACECEPYSQGGAEDNGELKK